MKYNLKNRLIFIAGLLTIIGGILWIIKAASILLTQNQPPLMYELGQALFALGVLGLYARLPNPNRIAMVGAVVAGTGLIARLGASWYEYSPGAVISGSEDFVLPYSLFVLLASLGAFVGLFLVSLPIYSDNTLSTRWRAIPLYTLLSFIPIAFTGAVHIEIPILLVGVGWMVIGYFLWKDKPNEWQDA